MNKKDEKLKKIIQTVFDCYRDVHLPNLRSVDFQLSFSGANIYLTNIDGRQDRAVSGKLSAWILFSGKYWAATYLDGLFSRYKSGEIPTLLSEVKPTRNLLETLVEGGNFFLSKKEPSEAQECFWAALCDASYDEEKSILEEIPEPYKLKLKNIYNERPLDRKIWKGRTSIRTLTAIKELAPFCSDKNPLNRFQALAFFLSSLDLGGGGTVVTGKHIHEIFMKSIYPCVNDPSGTVQQKDLECLERWVATLMNDYHRTYCFYEAVLPLIDQLLEYGINHRVHLQYRWEALVGMGKYKEAESNWTEIQTIVKEKLGRKKMYLSTIYVGEGDLTDWRITALTRAADSVLDAKKNEPEKLEYTKNLIQEAVMLAEPRVARYLNSRKKRDSKGFFANTYETLGRLQDKMNNKKEALAAYKFAKKIQVHLGHEWLQDKYNASIKHLSTK